MKKSREPGPGAISKEGPVCDEVKVLDAYYSNHIQRFKDWMVHKRYSPSSIKTYIDGVKSFLLYISPKRYSDVCHEDMVRFVNDRVVCRGLSFSYQNQVVSATKLFFREVVKSKLDVERFDRPRRQQKLPNVLSKHEVRKILTASANEKHRTMLAVIYACGLRRSELCNLKKTDVDSKRGLLLIRNAKGRKDRIVPISEKLIDMLRAYYMKFRPKEWLFEGQHSGNRYSEQSLQSVLKQAVSKSKISRPVT